MTRSVKKGPFVASCVIDKVIRMNSLPRKTSIKTWSRSTAILPVMIGHTFSVHNGQQHLPVFITEEMIGHKLGEFAPTRRFRSHRKKDKKGRMKNKN
jgi:small subunit ribosomal protein S19